MPKWTEKAEEGRENVTGTKDKFKVKEEVQIRTIQK